MALDLKMVFSNVGEKVQMRTPELMLTRADRKKAMLRWYVSKTRGNCR